ncbi:MAG TPA: hypothetical protein VGQ46_20750 [Thermoanaerobaculia bacterium]|nr:hypothetical protein [Thermoanaerobaculia bacterium]
MEEVLAFVRQYHLADRDPFIRTLVASLTGRPDQRTRAQLENRLQPFREFHRDHPFVTAPPGVLTGPLLLGRQTADDRPIGLTTDDVNLHGTIVGPSGAGKSTILLTLARALLNEGALLGAIDVKEDFGWLLREPDVLLIDEHTRWNFLQTPAFLTAAEHRADVIDLLLARLYGGELQRQLLDAGWQRAAAQHACFSLADLADAIAEAGGKETPSHAEARRSCIARLRRFAHSALFTTRDDGIPWEILLNRTFVVRSTGFDDLARFQFDLLSRYCFLSNRAARTSGLHRVLVIDESYELLSEAQNGIRTIETLPRLKQLAREFGIALLTTTVTLRGISDLAQASTHFYVALPPNNHEDARALIRAIGLTNEQTDVFLHGLQRGEALLRIGSWPEIIHLQIPPNTERKHATPEDLTRARARTNQLARAAAPSPATSTTSFTAAAREGIASTAQPTPSHESAPSSSPPARVAPVVEHNTDAPNLSHNTERVPLPVHAEALLQDSAEYPLSLTTASYDRLGIHWMQGDRAKQLLLKLGLLEAYKVTTGSGRGKTGSALRLTPAGWTWLGKQPAKGMRGGGGVQHEFLVRQLARRIARSTIETLGADLVLPYNAADHAHFVAALETLSGKAVALNNGDLLALEVECSMPARTGPRNIARDAGFALTVIATLGRHKLTASFGDRVVIVDVLRLLDALRTTEDG